MAAYNTGELRVLRAIMDGKTRDFWVMAKEKRLPKETQDYVPKFIAAAIIGLNPVQYGFQDPSNNPESYPSVVAVEVPARVRLRDIAQLAGIDSQVLTEVNPHLRQGVTPPTKGGYEIWVPEDAQEKVQGIKWALEKKQLAVKEVRDIEDTPFDHHHVIQNGETLSGIADKYRMSLRTLKNINNLASNKIFSGRKLRISAKGYKRPAPVATNHSNQARKPASRGQYQVKKGDTLGRISQQFGMTIKKLRDLNGIKGNRISEGEWLQVGPQKETSSL